MFVVAAKHTLYGTIGKVIVTTSDCAIVPKPPLYLGMVVLVVIGLSHPSGPDTLTLTPPDTDPTKV